MTPLYPIISLSLPRPCLPHSHFSSHLVPFPHLHCLGPCPIRIPVSAQCLPTIADLLFIAVPMPTRVPPLSLHQAPVPAQASVPVALHLWPRPHRSGSCPPHLCPHPYLRLWLPARPCLFHPPWLRAAPTSFQVQGLRTHFPLLPRPRPGASFCPSSWVLSPPPVRVLSGPA